MACTGRFIWFLSYFSCFYKRQKEFWKPIIIITLWCTWRWRNNIIFKDRKESFMGILQSIVSLYDTLPAKSYKRKRFNQKEQARDHTMLPRAYFDRAAQNSSWLWGYTLSWMKIYNISFPGMGERVQIAKLRRWLLQVF